MDINYFKKLVDQNRIEETQEFLQEFLKSEVSQTDKSSFLVGLASLQMQTQNSLNREYLNVLQNAIEALKEQDIAHSKVTEELETAILRKKIHES